MRTALLGLAAAAAALIHAGAAQAQVPVSYPVYPWCAEYGGRGGGGTNCYFSTWEQCRQAASGNGGYCHQNPFYGYAGYPGDQPRAVRNHRR
jgi:hypothetical protein